MKSGESWNIWAVEKGGAPAGWQWKNLAILDNAGSKRYDKMEGGVYKTLLKSGPRKGRINYRKPELGSERTFIIDHTEFKAWWTNWLIGHNICAECEGDGRIWIKTCTEGNFFKICPIGCEASVGIALHEPFPSL